MKITSSLKDATAELKADKMIYFSFRAMNTDIELRLYGLKARADATVETVKRLFEEAEDCLSRFRPTSELSRLNQNGYLEGASPLLFESVSRALAMAALSQGIFDPTILNALEAAGYNRSFEQIGWMSGSLDHSAYTRVPGFNQYRQLVLEKTGRVIRLPYNTRLDLGGIAKGMTVDHTARVLFKAGFTTFLVSAGGDMFTAGAPPSTPAGWQVGVLDPLILEGDLTRLLVRDRAIATSAVTRRRWLKGGRLQNHLIDPRTGQPVENGLASVTVVAPTTALADVLAKTALILGLEAGRLFIQEQPNCAALFVGLDGSLYRTTNLKECN